ncbi:uncharacterized protein ARMOST_17510 [Armillaria ostoyae]|uniref:Uncharacterized protein n=1 Tax=Armillaria ostoyae TaxID=47428 RepID=A0A284RZ92_ARMOS|nr:uncharacterized protein ARMOST_17510 [Armillaria ostoyae]
MPWLDSSLNTLRRITTEIMASDDHSSPNSALIKVQDAGMSLHYHDNGSDDNRSRIETVGDLAVDGKETAVDDDEPRALASQSHQAMKRDMLEEDEERRNADREILKQVTRARRKAERLERERDDALRELARSQVILDRQASEISSLRNLAKTLKDTRLEDMAEMTHLCKQNKALEQDLQIVSGKLLHEREQREADRRLLATRAKELHETEMFLTKADQFSGAEVKAMLQGLNTEILQLAADIIDVLQIEDSAMEVDGDQWLTGQHLIHGRMVQLLQTRDDSDIHATVVQAALQGVLTRLCRQLISEWSQRSSTDDDLHDIYRDIRKKYTNNHAVAGRWRSMTRESSKYSVVSETEENFYSRVTEAVLNVLRVAGWSPADAKGTLMQTFGKRVSAIVKAAMKLDRAMGEGITSQDLVVYTAHFDDHFDSNTMVDAYGNQKADGDVVACTCELGLKVSGGSNILLKTGVVLYSAFLT